MPTHDEIAHPSKPRLSSRRTAAARRHPCAVLFFLLISSTLALRLGWGWHVGRQLAAQNDAIRRRGEPVEPSEYVVKPLPPAENGWLLIVQAGALDTASSPSSSMLEYPAYPPYGSAWEQMARASEQSSAAEFQLVRRARGLNRAQVRVPGSPTLALTNFPPGVVESRAVMHTILDGAMFRHLQGNDSEAVERVRDVLHLAHLLEQDDSVVCQMIAYSIVAGAAEKARVIAPALHITPQLRPHVESLIRELLDERGTIERLRHSLMVERLVLTEYLGQRSAGTWALRPLADMQRVRGSERCAAIAVAAVTGDDESARRALGPWPEPWKSTPPQRSSSLAGPRAEDLPNYFLWFPSVGNLEGSLDQAFRCLADRRATAVSLAAQLFRAAHGRWPERLDELAPECLPAVAADPFHADGRPLGYMLLKGVLPGGTDRPIVYFDAGETENLALDPEPIYGWHSEYFPDPFADGHRRREVRQFRDLAVWLPAHRRSEPQPPATAPSTGPATQAAENDPPQPDAPRGDPKEQDQPRQ